MWLSLVSFNHAMFLSITSWLTPHGAPRAEHNIKYGHVEDVRTFFKLGHGDVPQTLSQQGCQSWYARSLHWQREPEFSQLGEMVEETAGGGVDNSGELWFLLWDFFMSLSDEGKSDYAAVEERLKVALGRDSSWTTSGPAYLLVCIFLLWAWRCWHEPAGHGGVSKLWRHCTEGQKVSELPGPPEPALKGQVSQTGEPLIWRRFWPQWRGAITPGRCYKDILWVHIANTGKSVTHKEERFNSVTGIVEAHTKITKITQNLATEAQPAWRFMLELQYRRNSCFQQLYSRLSYMHVRQNRYMYSSIFIGSHFMYV